MTTRRELLLATALGWVGSQIAGGGRPELRGEILGASHRVGHLLRDGDPARGTPSVIDRADVVIVGSGIAGLSAAWRMAPHGLDVRILELEPFVGGTSTWRDDGPVPHPWGAHYIPAPNPEARAVAKLLGEMGALTHYDAAGRPVYDPKLLCHAPAERLFYEGAWHYGLTPDAALDDETENELWRFSRLTDELGDRKGADGRYVFQIPTMLSSRDPEALALDRMSMAAWLDREGYKTPFFRWWVRYAMLDDFGAELDDVSAWAGLHYFSARRSASSDLEGSRFLVWPEGNGRLAKELLARSGARVVPRSLAVNVADDRAGARVLYVDVASGELRAIDARSVVLAVPAFVAKRLVPSAASLPVRTSSPWIVANLEVDRPLEPNHPWDSVLYDGEGLGYVDASHQLFVPNERTVLTYYRAFGAADVAATRQRLVRATWSELVAGVFSDLAPAHPDLVERTHRADVMIWGHAMPRPRPGFLGDRPFEPERRLSTRLTWGHVDVGGIALFEEAQHAGVLAAEAALEAAGVMPGETWT